MSEHETVAEMRSDANADEYTPDGILGQKLNYIADRLEAARKRERGNAAKLREALKLCLRGMCGYCRMDAEARGMTTECVNGCEVMLGAKAALAAPPRNCDRFATADEAIGAYRQTHKHMVVNVFLDWLLAPATEKEGGAEC